MISDERVVDAEPEILTRVLTPQDKFIVVASDGVWEVSTHRSCTHDFFFDDQSAF